MQSGPWEGRGLQQDGSVVGSSWKLLAALESYQEKWTLTQAVNHNCFLSLSLFRHQQEEESPKLKLLRVVLRAPSQVAQALGVIHHIKPTSTGIMLQIPSAPPGPLWKQLCSGRTTSGSDLTPDFL